MSTFQQCKFRYKLQYIDKEKPDFEHTAETFMGGLVHEILEKLYRELKGGFLNTKERLVEFYEKEWDENWKDDNVKIVREGLTSDYYKAMGKNFIENYYERNKPFTQAKVVDIETEDFIDLKDDNKYHIRIDRLVKSEDGTYFVCDYKTNKNMKSQGEVDEDRQLAMYSLWVKNHFEDCKNVKLIWYFLAHNMELVSERTEEQLKKLKEDIENEIIEIEACTDFETNKTPLCGWCGFKNKCPEWQNERNSSLLKYKNV